jgi:tetratricopeptide (TPR) repeat protein
MFNFFKKNKKDIQEDDSKALVEKAANSRNVKEAVDLYSQAIKVESEKPNPDKYFLSEVYRLRGDIYFSQGVAILSSSDWLHAIELNPENGIAHNNLGIWFTIEQFAKPDLKRAIEHFDLAVQYCPDRPDFVMNRAVIKIQDGQLEIGKKELEELYSQGYTDAKIAIERFC